VFNFLKNGVYSVTAEGNITMHGSTQKVKQNGTITVAGGKITLKSIFKIKPKSFGINVPDIADDIEITVESTFDK